MKAVDPELAVASWRAWETWLTKHHDRSLGVWLHIAKKAGPKSITYAEALDGALCWGWIDGQKRPCDEATYLQRFTPRRPRGQWSKRNVEHVERLTESKRMKPPGLAAVAAAKADGRWAAAYEPPSTSRVPDDFLRALAKNGAAQAFFETLNRVNRYAIAYRLASAKKRETRERRIDAFVAQLARHERFH